MQIKPRSSLGSWPRRGKLGLEFLEDLLDRPPRASIRFGLQHAPKALDVKADDLDLVHGSDSATHSPLAVSAKAREFLRPEEAEIELPPNHDKSVGCPTLYVQLIVMLASRSTAPQDPSRPRTLDRSDCAACGSIHMRFSQARLDPRWKSGRGSSGSDRVFAEHSPSPIRSTVVRRATRPGFHA